MLTVIDRERIRRAFYIEGKSRRQIAKEYKHSYWTIRKALESATVEPYLSSLKTSCENITQEPSRHRVEP